MGVDGDAQRISQIVWLLFLKIFDDKEQEWELTVPGYKSPLSSRFRWTNWAKDAEGITGEELIDFVNNNLFPVLKTLATAAGVSPQGKVVGAVFEDAYNYMKSGTLLRQVINSIEKDVDFNSSTDRHLFNDIYEKILADLQSAGNAGEYYTPRAVTQFMVDIIDPKLGEKLLDPACGTGGFLTNTIEHLKPFLKTAEDRVTLQENLNGVEKKPLPHMLAMTNVMLHGIDVPSNILHDNTLSRPLRDYGTKDRVDIIITNPPFGGMEEDGIESNFPKKYQTRETADLFMALIMHLLKPDTGRAAVVLPDGFLFGEGTKTNLKRELLEDFNLHTIVRLPKGVFSPYTSINTNILFFDKGGSTADVWFFEHPYPPGYKSYSRSKPLTIQEFDREKQWWKNRQPSEYAWKVSAQEIAARNYNLDCKNPHEVAINHRDPNELMREYLEIDREMKVAQNSLKQELMQALGAKRLDRSQRLLTVHTAALDRLLTAKDSSEFSTAWSFITQHFGELYSVKLGLIPKDFGDAYINQHTCLLRFMPICRNRYFPELMRTPLAKSQFVEPRRGIKNSFRLGDVGEMIIPLPPLAEQGRIVEKIDRLMGMCDRLEESIESGKVKQTDLLNALMSQV